MIVRRIVILTALACAAPLLAQPTTQRATTTTTAPPSRRPEPTSRRNYSDRYGVLEQHNIFLRDRSRPATASTQRSSSAATSQPVRKPEQMLVLTGVVLEDGGFRAYVEDASVTPPRILRVGPGDHLGPGRVMEIQIDAIAYDHAGQQKWIEVGSDMSGETVVPQLPSGATATTGPTTGPALNFDPNDPNLTTEQKMRLNAARQRGQAR